jgi:hypothetical protein
MTAYLETQRSCPHCGHGQRSKGYHTTQVRAVFGTIPVQSLRLYQCVCQAEHLLDWFHLTMRLTVLQQTAKGLPAQTRDEEADYPLRDPVLRELERLKWYLWHGHVCKALQVV